MNIIIIMMEIEKIKQLIIFLRPIEKNLDLNNIDSEHINKYDEKI